MDIKTKRTFCYSALLLSAIALGVVLPGCGGGNTSETLPTGEVKIEETKNENGEVVGSVQDEYKNMDPSGKQKK